jgi:lipid II:glycine glycyltransferase (peptidoglycan interpeptide bridge formation enzyme)
MARKAEKLGIRTAHRASVTDFQSLLDKTYDRLGIRPTHTASEFAWLCEHLPEDVYADVAYKDDLPIAGIGFFTINKRVNSSFYLCRDPKYKEYEALSLLIRDALRRSQSLGFTWFDFGTSSAGMRARSNLFMFKESFGAVGLFRETYQWEAR